MPGDAEIGGGSRSVRGSRSRHPKSNRTATGAPPGGPADTERPPRAADKPVDTAVADKPVDTTVADVLVSALPDPVRERRSKWAPADPDSRRSWPARVRRRWTRGVRAPRRRGRGRGIGTAPSGPGHAAAGSRPRPAGSVGGRDDPQVTAPAELVTVAGVALLVLAGSGWAGRLAYRLGQRHQVVGGGRRGFELALVADQFPAPGRGERASVRLAQVVRVRLGECRERADDRR